MAHDRHGRYPEAAVIRRVWLQLIVMSVTDPGYLHEQKKIKSLERINSVSETNGNFPRITHVNGWNLAIYMRHGSILPFVLGIQSIRCKLSITPLMYPGGHYHWGDGVPCSKLCRNSEEPSAMSVFGVRCFCGPVDRACWMSILYGSLDFDMNYSACERFRLIEL